MKKNLSLIVLTGPSGVGKSTLVQKLLTLYGPQILKSLVSYTTRPQRGTEKEGVDYHFLSEKTFLSLKDQGFFLEWSYVYGNYYATAKEAIYPKQAGFMPYQKRKSLKHLKQETASPNGVNIPKGHGFSVPRTSKYLGLLSSISGIFKCNWYKHGTKAIIKDFDLRGARNLKKLYPSSLVVFIAPPSLEELSRRLLKRRENQPKDIQTRIQQAKEELKQAGDFDHEVKNQDLEQATQALKQIIDPYLKGGL